MRERERDRKEEQTINVITNAICKCLVAQFLLMIGDHVHIILLACAHSSTNSFFPPSDFCLSKTIKSCILFTSCVCRLNLIDIFKHLVPFELHAQLTLVYFADIQLDFGEGNVMSYG